MSEPLPLPPALAAVWAAFFGAVIGSFLNVVIARVPARLSIVRPGSRCPKCEAPIAWYDNVPVVSWLLLRARCRRCRAPISARYPLVELLGLGAALLAFHRHGFSLPALAEFAFVAALVALAFIDLDTWLLPHVITRPLIAFGLVAAFFGLAAAPGWKSALYGAGVGFGVFLALSWIGEKLLKKEALGGGDIWLLAALGAFEGVGALLPIVLFASIQGSVVGIVLIALGRAQKGPAPEAPAADSEHAASVPGGLHPPGEDEAWTPPRHALPFGPFLALGALEWLYLADLIARAVPALELFR